MFNKSSFFKFTREAGSPKTVVHHWSPTTTPSLPSSNLEILLQYMQDWLELRYHFLLIQKILLVFKRRGLSKAITKSLKTSFQDAQKLLDEFEKNEIALEFREYLELFFNENSEHLKWSELLAFSHNNPLIKNFLLAFDELQWQMIGILSWEEVGYIQQLMQSSETEMILKIILEHPDCLFRNNLDELANVVDNSIVKDAILIFKNMPSSSKDIIYSLSRIIKKLSFEQRIELMHMNREKIFNFFEIYEFFKNLYSSEQLLNAFLELWIQSSELRNNFGFILRNSTKESLKEMPFIKSKARNILGNLQNLLPNLEYSAEEKWQNLLNMQKDFPDLLKKEFNQMDWLDNSFPNLYSFNVEFKPNYIYQFDNQLSLDKQKNQFNLFLDRTVNLIESEADFIHFYFKLLLGQEVMVDSSKETQAFEIGIVPADDSTVFGFDLNFFEYYSDIIHLSYTVSLLRNFNRFKNVERDINLHPNALVLG